MRTGTSGHLETWTVEVTSAAWSLAPFGDGTRCRATDMMGAMTTPRTTVWADGGAARSMTRHNQGAAAEAYGELETHGASEDDAARSRRQGWSPQAPAWDHPAQDPT